MSDINTFYREEKSYTFTEKTVAESVYTAAKEVADKLITPSHSLTTTADKVYSFIVVKMSEDTLYLAAWKKLDNGATVLAEKHFTTTDTDYSVLHNYLKGEAAQNLALGQPETQTPPSNPTTGSTKETTPNPTQKPANSTPGISITASLASENTSDTEPLPHSNPPSIPPVPSDIEDSTPQSRSATPSPSLSSESFYTLDPNDNDSERAPHPTPNLNIATQPTLPVNACDSKGSNTKYIDTSQPSNPKKTYSQDDLSFRSPKNRLIEIYSPEPDLNLTPRSTDDSVLHYLDKPSASDPAQYRNLSSTPHSTSSSSTSITPTKKYSNASTVVPSTAPTVSYSDASTVPAPPAMPPHKEYWAELQQQHPKLKEFTSQQFSSKVLEAPDEFENITIKHQDLKIPLLTIALYFAHQIHLCPGNKSKTLSDFLSLYKTEKSLDDLYQILLPSIAKQKPNETSPLQGKVPTILTQISLGGCPLTQGVKNEHTNNNLPGTVFRDLPPNVQEYVLEQSSISSENKDSAHREIPSAQDANDSSVPVSSEAASQLGHLPEEDVNDTQAHTPPSIRSSPPPQEPADTPLNDITDIHSRNPERRGAWRGSLANIPAGIVDQRKLIFKGKTSSTSTLPTQTPTPASSSTSSSGMPETVSSKVDQPGKQNPDSRPTEAFLGPGETQKEQEPAKPPNFGVEVQLPPDEDGMLNSELPYQRETIELSDPEQPETIETPAPEQPIVTPPPSTSNRQGTGSNIELVDVLDSSVNVSARTADIQYIVSLQTPVRPIYNEPPTEEEMVRDLKEYLPNHDDILIKDFLKTHSAHTRLQEYKLLKDHKLVPQTVRGRTFEEYLKARAPLDDSKAGPWIQQLEELYRKLSSQKKKIPAVLGDYAPLPQVSYTPPTNSPPTPYDNYLDKVIDRGLTSKEPITEPDSPVDRSPPPSLKTIQGKLQNAFNKTKQQLLKEHLKPILSEQLKKVAQKYEKFIKIAYDNSESEFSMDKKLSLIATYTEDCKKAQQQLNEFVDSIQYIPEQEKDPIPYNTFHQSILKEAQNARQWLQNLDFETYITYKSQHKTLHDIPNNKRKFLLSNNLYHLTESSLSKNQKDALESNTKTTEENKSILRSEFLNSNLSQEEISILKEHLKSHP